jgi:2-oxoglutarate dehydrogenase complex dehydrogenase (E1) component-like enzyme
MNFEREFSGPNLGYVLELYERYQTNPDSVNEASRRLFDEWKSANQEKERHDSCGLHKPLFSIARSGHIFW